MKTAQAFKDTSIFQGVVEFTDEIGRQWRYMKSGAGVYSQYVKVDGGFARMGSVSVTGKATPKKLHSGTRVDF